MSAVRGKYIAIFLIFLAGSSHTGLKGQETFADTLNARLEPLNDSTKLAELKKAAQAYKKSSLIRGLIIADIRKKLANNTGDPLIIADNHNLTGNLYLESNLYNKAEESYNLALQIYDSMDYPDGIATETHNIGIIYLAKNDTLKSIVYFKRSLEARQQSGNNKRIGDGLTTLGEIYLRFGMHDKSIVSLHKAADYYSDLTGYERKIDCYSYLADNCLIASHSNATEWIDLMEQETRLINSPLYESRINYRYARDFLNKNNSDEAAGRMDKISDLSHIYDEIYSPAEFYKSLSQQLLIEGNQKKSFEYSAIAREIHSEIERLRTSEIINNSKTRLDIYTAEEEIKQSEELNKFILRRIRTEEYIKYFIFISIFFLGITGIYLLISFYSIRRSNRQLIIRKHELEKAYERSVRYKDSLLLLRENKNIFFTMISYKLSVPFNDLTNKLNKLHKLTLKKFEMPSFVNELKRIDNLAKTIERSLKRILLWSSLQRRRYSVNFENINVSDYMHELLPELLRMTVKKQIKIRFDIDPDLAIDFDRHSLNTILRVLIENSLETSDNNSEIIMRGHKARTGSIISVTDFGSGIPASVQNTIFEITRYKEDTMSNNDEKLGLGLLLAHQMAKINNSYISFESNSKKGTTFFIHIKS
ncbi:MAG: hypothetical protein K8R35_07550 [Bacteroidales bacterium]|nr:hypothetical protein [Bacteroidales bacterium]